MIQEVINNITGAENEAEDIVKIATKRAKDIKLQAEYQCEVIAKRNSEDCKKAANLRRDNADIAARKKAEIVIKEGNKEIADFVEKCSKNRAAASKIVAEKLIDKYGNN